MPRDGGRPCGCDPKANHPCTGHAAHVDTMEVEFKNDDGTESVVVSGPDEKGRFTIAAWNAGSHGGCKFAHVGRFVVEDIIEELQRRLKERA